MVGHTEFRYDGVCSESVLGDFPETIVGNCVLLQKPEKCSFWQTKTDYLGFIIEEGKIGMDPTKLKGIADWPTLTTVKQVRSFLGFGNYYQRFIHGYGDLTKLLNDLLRKEEKCYVSITMST